VTLTSTLTLDRVILHTVVHHSSTSIPIHVKVVKIVVTFCGRTDGRTYIRTDGRTDGRTFVIFLLYRFGE